MNNRVGKPTAQKKKSEAAPADGPKLLDPVIGLKARPVQGAKVYSLSPLLPACAESGGSDAADGAAAVAEPQRHPCAASVARDAGAQPDVAHGGRVRPLGAAAVLRLEALVGDEAHAGAQARARLFQLARPAQFPQEALAAADGPRARRGAARRREPVPADGHRPAAVSGLPQQRRGAVLQAGGRRRARAADRQSLGAVLRQGQQLPTQRVVPQQPGHVLLALLPPRAVGRHHAGQARQAQQQGRNLAGAVCSEDDCEDCGGFECSEKHHEHSDYGDDLHYTSYLFDELAFSRATNQIIVPCNIEFMSQLMSRADQEVVGDWGDRHARTIAEAQDEVLICLGMVIWDKIQNLWTKSRSEKRSEELLVHCAVSTLRRNFDVAVEALHGEEMMEQLLAEEDDESRRLAKKKEKRKEKKKKRKSATKLKQADRSESEKSQQADKQKPKQTKTRKQSDSSKTVTSQSSTNSLSSQGDDDDLNNSSRSMDPMETHQCDSTCDEPCLRGNLTYDERMEWQLLSSMGWDASNQFTSSLPELDVDTDDENHGIPEDEIRFWKQNRSSLVRRRMAQRQKLQERFDQFVLRTSSLDA
ncbi:hypothetical protein ON010_g14683 [Phytophthora cinnamomi]|nr:hypothetical protein ON010_g14683 [Phytophthora cinnamomi]